MCADYAGAFECRAWVLGQAPAANRDLVFPGGIKEFRPLLKRCIKCSFFFEKLCIVASLMNTLFEPGSAPIPEGTGKRTGVRAIVPWLCSRVLSIIDRLRTGVCKIINAFRSDWHWVFRDGPTVLPKAISTLQTILFWFTSASNLDSFLKPGRWHKNFKD